MLDNSIKSCSCARQCHCESSRINSPTFTAIGNPNHFFAGVGELIFVLTVTLSYPEQAVPQFDKNVFRPVGFTVKTEQGVSDFVINLCTADS